jgi:5-methylcytosine-specific restriction endonuclease McrA
MASRLHCSIICSKCDRMKTNGVCLPCRKEWFKEHYNKNKDKYKDKNAVQYEKHQQRNINYVREYRKQHSVEVAESAKKHYEKNRQRINGEQKERRNQYKERNTKTPPPFDEATFRVCPGCNQNRVTKNFYFFPSNSHGYSVYCKFCNQIRNAARRGLRISVQEWEYVISKFDNKCCYCDNAENVTVDHFIPIFLGGTGNTNNIVPACKSCNLKKNKTDPHVWIERTFGINHPMLNFRGEKIIGNKN